MSKIAKQHKTDAFVIPLTETCVVLSDQIEMSENDLKKFRGVHPLYKAFAATFGSRLGPPVLCGSEVRLEVRPDEKDLGYNTPDFMVDLGNTAKELQANANRDSPLPYSKAVKRPTLVRILEANSAANHAHNLKARAEINGVHYPIPILDPGDFVGPETHGELRRTGTFLVTGLRRNDSKGNGLYITENELPVCMPSDVSCWTWQKIRRVLDCETFLVGTITRESKSHPWMPSGDARLESLRISVIVTARFGRS